MTPDRLLDVSTVAKMFGVSSQTIKNWIKAGKLACEKTSGGFYKIPSSAAAALRKSQKSQIDHV